MHDHTCIFHSRKTWSNSGKAFDPRFHAFVRWRIKDLLAICTSRKVLQKKQTNNGTPGDFQEIQDYQNSNRNWSPMVPMVPLNILKCAMPKRQIVPRPRPGTVLLQTGAQVKPGSFIWCKCGCDNEPTENIQMAYRWLQYLKTSNNVARLHEQHGKRFSPRPTHDEHRIKSNSGTLTSNIIQHHSNYHTWNAGGLCKPNSIATPSTPRPQHLGRVSQEWLELSQLQRQEKVKSC